VGLPAALNAAKGETAMAFWERIGFAAPGPLTVKIAASAALVVVLWLLRILLCSVAKRRLADAARFYHVRRYISYGISGLGVILIGRIWIRGIDSIATFLGLASAGLAIALHDTIANIAGWIFILFRKPFEVGNRIQIGEQIGDVIDIRMFEFSLLEVGNWVHADQSTGRMVHVPNSRVLREPLANFEMGFEYIWHEIPVLITFESDWEMAKEILLRIVNEKAGHLAQGMEEQIRRAAMRYLIYFKTLTPTVYTTVRDSGVLLTLRYIVKPRQRRGSEQDIWETILREFARHDAISLAYPTTRFYRTPDPCPAPPSASSPSNWILRHP
jgi:small-conductance mechanosensitive channel